MMNLPAPGNRLMASGQVGYIADRLASTDNPSIEVLSLAERSSTRTSRPSPQETAEQIRPEMSGGAGQQYHGADSSFAFVSEARRSPGRSHWRETPAGFPFTTY